MLFSIFKTETYDMDDVSRYIEKNLLRFDWDLQILCERQQNLTKPQSDKMSRQMSFN